MTLRKPDGLSRRERQIMDILHRRGRTTPAQVKAELPDAPTYTAVNSLLRTLLQNGLVLREQEGPHFVYYPAQPRGDAAKSALRKLVDTFFEGSMERAMTTLLSDEELNITNDEMDRLSAVIERSRARGAGSEGVRSVLPTDPEGIG